MATRIYEYIDQWKIGDIYQKDFNIRREKLDHPIIAKGNIIEGIKAKY